MKRLLLAAVVLVLVAAAGTGWWLHRRLSEPYGEFPNAGVFVELPPGTGVSGIATRLAAAGAIRDPWSFRLGLRLTGRDRRLQAGEYRFDAPATVYDVIDRLARGDVYTHPVTFPEGLTVAEMAAVYERSGLGTREAFLAAAAAAVPPAGDEADSVEGYLFPDTYRLARRAGADELIAAMLAGFRQAFPDDLRDEARARGLSLHEVVTLASLIEKETAVDAERPIVSGVYHNRIARGMLLQCDPTVIYALIREGRWNGNIRRVDLDIDSPYNTYRYAGLPPGPIAAPGRAALEAAVRPADVPYLYFVSRNDGSHVFATTLAEHNRNVREWQVAYFRNRGR